MSIRPGPLWPGGASRFGARFTPKGAFDTIYLADHPVTALAEVGLVFTHGGRFTLRHDPWVLVAVAGTVHDVLDLADESIQAKLGISMVDLARDWRVTQAEFVAGRGPEPPTQTLGAAIYASGRFRGLIYPSSRNPPDGRCLAVFPDRLRTNDRVEVVDAHGHFIDRYP